LLVTQTFPYAEWQENGGGFSANLVKRLLKSLPTPRGSAVVLNAKGGREVSVLSKADMKFVACYSAGKESYPGKLIATVPTVVEEQEEVWTAPRLAEVLRTGLEGHGGAVLAAQGGGKETRMRRRRRSGRKRSSRKTLRKVRTKRKRCRVGKELDKMRALVWGKLWCKRACTG
jgi:hypothetical protein